MLIKVLFYKCVQQFKVEMMALATIIVSVILNLSGRMKLIVIVGFEWGNFYRRTSS